MIGFVLLILKSAVVGTAASWLQKLAAPYLRKIKAFVTKHWPHKKA